jgi:hypothetical protein
MGKKVTHSYLFVSNNITLIRTAFALGKEKQHSEEEWRGLANRRKLGKRTEPNRRGRQERRRTKYITW